MHSLLIRVKHVMTSLNEQIITEMAKFKVVNEVSLYLEEPISLNRTNGWRQKQQYDFKVKIFKDNIHRASEVAFEKFNTLLATLKEEKKNGYDLRTYLAVALYFVTYFHPKNQDCKKYLQKNEFI